MTKAFFYAIISTQQRKEVIKMSKKKNKELDKRMFKKTPEELEQYLHFKKRGFAIDNKKGKGSYTRKIKHRKGFDE